MAGLEACAAMEPTMSWPRVPVHGADNELAEGAFQAWPGPRAGSAGNPDVAAEDHAADDVVAGLLYPSCEYGAGCGAPAAEGVHGAHDARPRL